MTLEDKLLVVGAVAFFLGMAIGAVVVVLTALLVLTRSF